MQKTSTLRVVFAHELQKKYFQAIFLKVLLENTVDLSLCFGPEKESQIQSFFKASLPRFEPLTLTSFRIVYSTYARKLMAILNP